MIKTANERCNEVPMLSHHNACMQEITDLRTALAERDADNDGLAGRNVELEIADRAYRTELAALRAAARQGLDALQQPFVGLDFVQWQVVLKAIATLTSALEEKA